MALSEKDLKQDPIQQFRCWFEEACSKSGMRNPNAFCLATVDPGGAPNSRMVLLKDFSHQGFTFYTNETSVKGESLKILPLAAMTFYWDLMKRQVRIQGSTSFVSTEECDRYFASRERLSQLGAWASEQSKPLRGREQLEEKLRALDEQYRGKEIPRPPYWRGYLVEPQRIEFWQEQPGRLHDRFEYAKGISGAWSLIRLAP